MLMCLIAFELIYHARQVPFRIACLVFFVGGLAMAQGGYGGPEILRNAPFAVTFFVGLFSLGSVIPIALFAGGAILRDRECRMEGIVFATSITHAQYVVSRFAGLTGASLLAFSTAVLGLFVGSLLPWANGEHLGPISPWPYVWGWLVIGIPNVLLSAALIFATAALTKNAMATYISGIFLYILYWLGSVLGNSPLMAGSSYLAPQHAELSALLEPYGMIGFLEQARYWTVFEKNTRFVALEGTFLLNRMFWTGFALSLFALTYRLFRFRQLGGRRIKLKKLTRETTPKPATYRPVEPTRVGWAHHLAAFRSQTRIGFRTAVQGYPFYALLLLWTFFIVMDLHQRIGRGELNVPYVPVTGLLLPYIHSPLRILGALVVIFFAGELSWHERIRGMSGLLDACPCPNLVFWASKVAALAAVIVTLIAFSIGLGVAVQSFHGYFAWEWGVYASLFWRTGLPLLYVGILALTIQTLSPNKYTGLAVSIVLVVFFSGVVLPQSPWIEHPLLRFGFTPELIYSPMAGTGFHDPATAGFLVYWSAVAGLLGVAALKYWRRGWGIRSQILGPFERRLGWAFFLLFLISGGAVFYHTNVVNTYRSTSQTLDWRADYEQSYAGYAGKPTPTMIDLKVAVDLFPAERRITARGRMVIENQNEGALREVLVALHPGVDAHQIGLDQAALQFEDAVHGQRGFSLDPPLATGERRTLEFQFAVRTSSFEPLNPENYVTAHAAYVELDKLLPFFGYDADRAIRNKGERRKRGLPELTDSTKPAVPEKRDWCGFEAVIGTVTGQTVVSLGNLVRQWEKDGRSYFHYRSERELPAGIGIASAVYQAERTTIDGVALTVYIQPGHDYNLDRVLAGAADSLAYYRRHFGEYPDKVLKIAELPGFSDRFGGTSYPNTIFAVENRLFLLHQSPRTIDVAYRIIAHEIGHQWWGGLLDPAPVDGARLLTEILAVYSEMVVYEDTHPPRDTREYLDITNDLYFYFRGFERDVERPLTQVRRQPYVYYFKGAQVVFALRELMGEARINQVLRQFLADYAYPRKPTPGDLVERLLAAAPQNSRPKIDELFNQVVTYDLKILSATRETFDEGGFQITAKISAQKTRLDAHGRETVTPVTDALEVGLWRTGELLEVQQVNPADSPTTITLQTAQRVDAISLDPHRLYIDANRGDNLLSLAGKAETL